MSDDSPERVTETWACMGARVGAKERRVNAWRQPNGRIARFLGRESYVTGGLYEVTVSRPTEEGVTMHGAPRYTGERYKGTAEQAAWRAEEVAAEARLAQLAAERKHKGEDPLDEILDPLVAAACRLRSSADRDAFLAHVNREIALRAWGRRT
jgi:hypothetical protein